MSWTGAHLHRWDRGQPELHCWSERGVPHGPARVSRVGAPARGQVTPQTCWTQDWGSRYQDSFTNNADGSWPSYRLDHNAATPGAADVGVPASLPAGTFGNCQSEESGAFAAPVQYLGALGCRKMATVLRRWTQRGYCGEPPEATNIGGAALPSNETYGVSKADGSGNTEFDVFNAVENATLGCSQTVPCSLVAVPIMGIDCDADLVGGSPSAADQASIADCEKTGYYQPGAQQAGQSQDPDELTVSGSLWWSASNWQNRISVPLTFAPPLGRMQLGRVRERRRYLRFRAHTSGHHPVGAELLSERHQ